MTSLDWGTPPDPPPPDQQRLVGLYGRRGAQLSLFEDGGALFADGCGFARAPVGPARDGVRLATRAPTAEGPSPAPLRLHERGHAAFITIGEARYERRDFDSEAAAPERAPNTRDPSPGGPASPPVDPSATLANDLVCVLEIDPTIRLDIRYATADNFMGFPLYEAPVAYLQRPAAEALGRVQRAIAAQGYGLIVHDAYRPWSITRLFWDAIPPAFRAFVADPAVGSKHNRGCAVDVTLCALTDGEAVDMPGRYDEASARSSAGFTGGASRQRWFRDRLREAMEAAGFAVQPDEWWHFDFETWRDYPVSDIGLMAIMAPRTTAPPSHCSGASRSPRKTMAPTIANSGARVSKSADRPTGSALRPIR